MTNPIVNWRLKLDADEEWDLDLLIEHFRSDDCIVMREADGACYLMSDRFRDLQDYKEVVVTARPLMAAMNGVAKALAPWFQPVNSDKLTPIHQNGGRGAVLLAGPIVFRMLQDIPPRELQISPLTSLGKAEFLVQAAKLDARLATALRIFGIRPPTWVNLYNIFEIVCEDVGGWKIIVANGWAEKSELDRFRQTANDPDIIGDDARHGRSTKSTKSKNFQPMAHEDAKALLHRLIRSWLHLKAVDAAQGGARI